MRARRPRISWFPANRCRPYGTREATVTAVLVQFGVSRLGLSSPPASASTAPRMSYTGKNVYELSDQKTPERFTARKVKIIGTLDTKGSAAK
jgi:hypothetical protein